MQRRFSFLVSRFLKWASKVLERSTVAVYRHYFTRFVEYHGDLLLSKLRPLHLSEWARTWHQAQAIKRLFNWALLDAGLISLNPFARVKHPPKGARHRIMTRLEMLTLLRRTRGDLRMLLLIHRETFARPEELRIATWADLRPNDSLPALKAALRSGNAVIVLHDYKARKRRRLATAPRVILLSPRAGRLICRLLERAEILKGEIFRSARGLAWTANAVRCRFRRLRTKHKLQRDVRGENIVPYTFRHTGATLACAAGVRDRCLADILSHTETSTTARYQHLSLDHLREAMRPLWHRVRVLPRLRHDSLNQNP